MLNQWLYLCIAKSFHNGIFFSTDINCINELTTHFLGRLTQFFRYFTDTSNSESEWKNFQQITILSVPSPKPLWRAAAAGSFFWISRARAGARVRRPSPESSEKTLLLVSSVISVSALSAYRKSEADFMRVSLNPFGNDNISVLFVVFGYVKSHCSGPVPFCGLLFCHLCEPSMAARFPVW